MLLFLLTAREGRVSANQLGCPVIAQFQTLPTFAHVPRRRIRVSRAPAQRAIPTTKPAVLRVFYIGTNSGWGALLTLHSVLFRFPSLTACLQSNKSSPAPIANSRNRCST